MGEFKVGDRVRQISDDFWYGIEGVFVGERDGFEIFIPAEGSVFSDGSKCGHIGKEAGMFKGSFELVESATDELATLRAFREQALARYPDLAEPESDEDAVKRLVRNYYDADQMADDLVRAAIAWARANPR